MKLDVEAARRAVKDIADRVGSSLEETAYRILTLAGDFMMRAIRDITINEGFNPRESTIVAGGGAAGLNIMMIAAELGCDRVVLPKVAAALSASGMQHANIVAEETATLVTVSNRFDFDKVNALLAELTSRLETFRRGLGERGTTTPSNTLPRRAISRRSGSWKPFSPKRASAARRMWRLWLPPSTKFTNASLRFAMKAALSKS